MQDYAARLQTLAQGINQWPGYRINASEKDIAQAGFYYLGESKGSKVCFKHSL